MRHSYRPWEDPAKTPAQRFMGEPQRRCEHCGAVQSRETQYSWMRVTGYRWYPPAGRCKAAESISGQKG